MKRFGLIIICVASIWALPVEKEATPSRTIPLKDIGQRIISGSVATRGQFPWQVAVYFTTTGGETHFCGGSLISSEWILTAAHCAQGAISFTIYLGTATLNPDSGAVVLTTSTAVVHPQYNSQSLNNDVAVIKLPSAVTFNNNIRPITLATSTLGSGISVTVSGFGKTSDNTSTVSNTLNYVTLTSISNNQCSNYYGDLSSGIICAIGSTIQSTCNGDSGGPLITGSGDSALHVGVVSFVSARGCESGSPSGYSRTAYQRNWIRQTTGV